MHLAALLVSISLWAPAPQGTLALRAAPTEAGALRDVVWPALATARISGWTLVAAEAEADGALWASQPAPEVIRLHRALFGPGREATVDLPLGSGAAWREAVQLRLAFLLGTAVGVGRPWRPPPPPPPPARGLLSQERARDLTSTVPRILARRQTRVPLPPGPLAAAPAADPAVDRADPGSGRFRLGADALIDVDGFSPGFVLDAAFQVGAHWRLGVQLAGYPFHDFRRDGQALGVSATRVTLRAGRVLMAGASTAMVVHGGLFYAGLHADGQGTSSADPRFGVSAGLAGELALGGPLSLALEGDALVAPWESTATFGDEVLLAQGPVQLRLGLLLGWALW